MCHFKDTIHKYEWNNFVRDHPCGYTCMENGRFLKHLAYASQVFKDGYTWQFYSRGQSSLISVGELHDTNLSTFFSNSHFLRVSSYNFAICIFSRLLKPLLCIQDGRLDHLASLLR